MGAAGGDARAPLLHLSNPHAFDLAADLDVFADLVAQTSGAAVGLQKHSPICVIRRCQHNVAQAEHAQRERFAKNVIFNAIQFDLVSATRKHTAADAQSLRSEFVTPEFRLQITGNCDAERYQGQGADNVWPRRVKILAEVNGAEDQHTAEEQTHQKDVEI